MMAQPMALAPMTSLVLELAGRWPGLAQMRTFRHIKPHKPPPP
jgi:hypothetical protein